MRAVFYLKRLMLWLGGFVLLILLFMIVINLPDEELLPEAVQFAKLPPLPFAEEENGYIYRLGFDAPEGEDPLQLGKERLAWFIANKEKYSTPSYLEGNEIQFHGNRDALCCFSGSSSCLEVLLKNQVTISETLNKNDELLKRFQRLISYKGAVQNNDQMNAEMWHASLVLMGQRLYFTQALLTWRQGRFREAIGLLNSDLRFWRRTMAHGSMLDKMIAMVALSRLLHAYNELAHSDHFDRQLVEYALNSVTDFSEQELDMSLAWQSEFAMGSRVVFDTESNAIGEGWFSTLATKLFFKPNATVNGQYRMIRQVIRNDKQKLFGKVDLPGNDDENVDDDLLGVLYNPIGKFIIDIALNDDIYVERAKALDRRMKDLRKLLLEKAT